MSNDCRKRGRVNRQRADLEHSNKGDVTHLKFHGVLDAASLPTIKKEFDALLEQGATRVVFNINGLEFINSAALGFLVAAQKRLRESHGELVLSAPSKFFQTKIVTLGIDRFLKIFPTDEEAFKYFDDADGGGVLPEAQPPDLG